MKIRRFYCLSVPLVAIVLSVTSSAFALDANLCVKGFCIDSTPKKAFNSIASVATKVQRSDDQGPSLCFFDATSGSWAEFTFGGTEEHAHRDVLRGITLTLTPICPKRSSPAEIGFGKSVDGFSLGQSESEVIATRGKPVRVDDAIAREKRDPMMAGTRYSAKFGPRVLVYERNEATTFVFIRNGTVATIWTSVGE